MKHLKTFNEISENISTDNKKLKPGDKIVIKGTKSILTFVKYEIFPDGLYVWVKERKCAIPSNIVTKKEE
jgi:hypothetical protein